MIDKIRYVIADQPEIDKLANTDSAIRVNDGLANMPIWFVPFDVYVRQILGLPEYIIQQTGGFANPHDCSWQKIVTADGRKETIDDEEARSYIRTGYYTSNSNSCPDNILEIRKITIMRNEKILSIATIFLERYADELTNSSCNELDSELVELIQNDDWLDEIKRWDSGLDVNKIEQVPDWLLARFISHKLKQMANDNN